MTNQPNGDQKPQNAALNLVGEFDGIVDQLRDMLDSLQGRVIELTDNLQVAADVSTQVATILDPEELLPSLVETVKQRFGLYHAHVYLLNEETEMLELAAGAGEAGEAMMAHGHSISLDAEKSLVARAARTGEAVLVQDVTADPTHLPNPLLPETLSEMAIPMLIGDRVIGVLDVQHDERNRFSEIDRQVKTTLAEQLAVAIQNAEAFARTQEYQKDLQLRTKDLQIAADISRTVANILQLDKLLPRLADAISDGFELHHTNIYLADAERENLILTASSGKAGRQLLARNYSIRIDNKTNLAAEAARTGEAVIVNNINENDNFIYDDLVEGTVAKMAVPMLIGDDIVGVLAVQHNEINRFDENDVRVQTTLAEQLAVAINNAEAFAQVQEVRAELLLSNQAIEASNSGVTIADVSQPDMPLIYVNPAFEQITGYTEEEVIGKNCRFLQSDDRDQEALDQIRNALANGGSVTVELRNYRKDGGMFWNELSLSPLYDNEGNLTNYVGVQTDITDRKLAEQREILAYEIGRELNETNGVEELLQVAVDRLATAFDYYYAHIYVYQPETENLRVGAGLGEAGKTMVERGHSIALDAPRSLVAQAARIFDPVLVMDVTDDPTHLPNPLIPDTLSEVAVPLYLGNVLLGVLDVQSSNVAAFDDNEVRLLNIVANQLSVALSNANQLQRAEIRLRNVQVANDTSNIVSESETVEELMHEVMVLVLDALGADNAIYTELVEGGKKWQGQVGVGNTDSEFAKTIYLDYQELPHGVDAVERNRIFKLDNAVNYEDFDTEFLQSIGMQSVAVMPLNSRRDRIGAVFFNFTDHFHVFTPEEIDLLAGVARQLGTAVESKRQAQLIEQRAHDLETVSEIATRAANNLNLEDMLYEVCDLTKVGFSHYHAHIYLFDESREHLNLVAGAGEVGRMMVERGHDIPSDRKASLVAGAARRGVGVIANDITAAPDHLPNPLLPETQSELAIPLLVNNRVIGVLDVQSARKGRFSDTDVISHEILARQIGVAVSNARSFEAEQTARQENERRAREMETVAQVSTAASTLLDVDELLSSVVELTKLSFDLYHAHIYLYDEEDGILWMEAGAGDAGAIMKMNRHNIEYASPTSIVARAARERQTVVIADVTDSESFLPNPLLPETRSEMAIPMLVGRVLVGVLDVQSEQVERFGKNEVRVLQTLAAQVAVATDNAQAFQLAEQIAQREAAAAERLREVDRLKSEFLASMSHELRTPLNSIIGYSEVMLDGGDGELNDEAMEDIEIIYTSGRHLLNIINDILDLAKIEANQMQISRKPTDLVKLMEGVIKANEVLVGDAPVELRFESEVDELVVPADELRIRQVVLNLFSNAVKFTEEGSVTIELSMHQDDMVRVAVTDTGIGISEEGQQIVFDQFRQVDGSSTRKAGGTGLGLTITRHLVNLHGGEIYVDSEEGVGTTFWFTLPLVIPEETEGESDRSEVQPV